MTSVCLYIIIINIICFVHVLMTWVLEYEHFYFVFCTCPFWPECIYMFIFNLYLAHVLIDLSAYIYDHFRFVICTCPIGLSAYIWSFLSFNFALSYWPMCAYIAFIHLIVCAYLYIDLFVFCYPIVISIIMPFWLWIFTIINYSNSIHNCIHYSMLISTK